MAKYNQKLDARKLRRDGESIKVIAKKLDVSAGSVSNWCRDITLLPKQLSELQRRAHDPHYGRRQKYLNQIKKRTENKIKRLKKEGIQEVGNLSKRDLFLIGIALYWAEGFKKDHQAGFANSNPLMVKLFIKWLTVTCGYSISDLSFRVTLNISHKYRVEEVERYWQDVTEASPSQFQKPFFQKVTWKKVYEHPEQYFGVLRIRVRKSADFLRKIHGWIEGIASNPIQS